MDDETESHDYPLLAMGRLEPLYPYAARCSLVIRLVQWGIPRCEMGQTTMQSLGDLSLNLAGSVKLPYMGNLKKENSHVIAK